MHGGVTRTCLSVCVGDEKVETLWSWACWDSSKHQSIPSSSVLTYSAAEIDIRGGVFLSISVFSRLGIFGQYDLFNYKHSLTADLIFQLQGQTTFKCWRSTFLNISAADYREPTRPHSASIFISSPALSPPASICSSLNNSWGHAACRL